MFDHKVLSNQDFSIYDNVLLLFQEIYKKKERERGKRSPKSKQHLLSFDFFEEKSVGNADSCPFFFTRLLTTTILDDFRPNEVNLLAFFLSTQQMGLGPRTKKDNPLSVWKKGKKKRKSGQAEKNTLQKWKEVAYPEFKPCCKLPYR